MQKILILFLFLIIMLTGIIAVKRPVMHKQVLIEDINFTVLEEASGVSIAANNQVKEPTYIPPKKDDNNKVAKILSKSEKNKQPETKATSNKKPAKVTENKSGRTIATKPQNTAVKTKNESKSQLPSKISASKEVSEIQNPPKSKRAEIVNEIPTFQEIPKLKEQKTSEPRQLTEQEEIIAWNKWRSDLQNQVMRDAKIIAPLGTAFKFSFTVDKFGTISNLKVWSTDPVYTNAGIRVIKPILLGYQGKYILEFPQGTKRIITNVTGGFVMARETNYSSPKDYSDYEKVKVRN